MCTGMTHYNRPDGWISVKDRLPETMKNVLVYENDGGTSIGFFAQHIACWCVFRFFGENKEPSVTHWRELPDPPRTEEKNED